MAITSPGRRGPINVVQFHAAYFFKCIDGFQNGNAVTGSEVEHFAALGIAAFYQVFDGQRMCMGDIAHMDEVADAASVACVIIGAMNSHLWQFADGCLCNGGNEIGRFADGQLADSGRAGCAPAGLK